MRAEKKEREPDNRQLAKVRQHEKKREKSKIAIHTASRQTHTRPHHLYEFIFIAIKTLEKDLNFVRKSLDMN